MDHVAYQAIPVDWNDYRPRSTDRSSTSDDSRKKIYLLGGLIFVFLLILGVVFPILHHKHPEQHAVTDSKIWEPLNEDFQWSEFEWVEDDEIYGEAVHEEFDAEEFYEEFDTEEIFISDPDEGDDGLEINVISHN
jgi:hypothetical protein